MKMMILFAFLLAPLAYSEQQASSAEMWWCSSCGLAYPASQKFCLNKDCPLFRKKR